MKLKKLIIICGIVAILLAAVLSKSILQKIRVRLAQSPEPAAVLMKEDPNIFTAKIEIYNGAAEKDKLVLVKEPSGEWIVENKFGIKARKDAVENLLNNLKQLKGEVRGESKELFVDFEIFDNQSGHLILKGGSDKVLLHLVVSFKRPNWNQSYVRLAGSQNIILVNREVLSWLGMFDKTAKPDNGMFADYKVFSFDVNSIIKTELLDGPKRSLVLFRNEPAVAWKFEKPSRKTEIPNSNKVNDFLVGILNSYALDAADPKLIGYGFDQPAKTLKLTLLKNKKPGQIQIDIGSFIKDKNAYYARILPENRVFLFTDAFVKSLDRDKASFIAKPVKTKKKR